MFTYLLSAITICICTYFTMIMFDDYDLNHIHLIEVLCLHEKSFIAILPKSHYNHSCAT